jgi:D-amino-acid oxidase
MHDIDVVVIGAGVIGIAVGRALALAGREVLIIERERHFGTGTSSRNSEVIHAGIYYPHGSLKARLCVEGRRKLYAFCESRNVPHRRCGKLIVATNVEQEAQLAQIASRASENGVDLQALDRAEVRALEPEIASTAALLSPSTGIVDSHALMLAMLGEAEASGATVAYGTSLSRIDACADGFALFHAEEEQPLLRARNLINAAGLHATDVARIISGLSADHIPRPYFAKGSYFSYGGPPPFQRLVYPVPVNGGLGIHATLDLAGRVRFGPDVEWCDTIDYGVEETRAEPFYAAIRDYWPGLRTGTLRADYAGIRPKLSGPDQQPADFLINGPEAHRLQGLINLFGIESPGLTAALALGEEVVAILHRHGR